MRSKFRVVLIVELHSILFQILDRKNAEIEDVKTQYRAKAKEMEDTVNKLEKKSKMFLCFKLAEYLRNILLLLFLGENVYSLLLELFWWNHSSEIHNAWFDVWTRIISTFLARLNNIHGELLYYPRHWRRHWRRHPQMLKFLLKVFKTTLFPDMITDLIHLWYEDIYWSKILRITIPTIQGHVKVKVTDLELSC